MARYPWQRCRSGWADGLLRDEDAGSRRPKDICQSCLGNDRRGFGRCEPARFPLRLFRPFADLPLDCEQKDRDFKDSRFARVAAFLVAIETDGIFADDRAQQPCFLVCFSGRGRAGRQISNWPAFGNDPVPPSAGRNKQNLDLTVVCDPEWEGAALISNSRVCSGHRTVSGTHSLCPSPQTLKHARPRRRNFSGLRSEKC